MAAFKQVDRNTQSIVGGKELESGSAIKTDSKMLITGKSTPMSLAMLLIFAVSAANSVRDELRDVVRHHLADRIRFFELEYQPS